MPLGKFKKPFALGEGELVFGTAGSGISVGMRELRACDPGTACVSSPAYVLLQARPEGCFAAWRPVLPLRPINRAASSLDGKRDVAGVLLNIICVDAVLFISDTLAYIEIF
jgi:hypothetical protein